MSEHTKEPWNFIHNNFQFSSIYSDDSLIAECIIHNSVNEENEFDLVGKKEADARRIVACVNACAGIDTDELEKYGALAIIGMAKRTNHG